MYIKNNKEFFGGEVDKEKILKLAKSLYFVPNEKVIYTILTEKDQMLARINYLHQFDTKSIQPLEKINSLPKGIEILFEDIPDFTSFREQLFDNSIHNSEKQIIIKKVIDD
ncbi:glutamyl-tRNA amidotransferase [Mesomycoplasma hyopneumoniae]|nr:glutamyl-tRNA amidotransferase [Mesomycoplasma hyopneumoniae]